VQAVQRVRGFFLKTFKNRCQVLPIPPCHRATVAPRSALFLKW
jgi:hypothetical protein